MRGKLACVCRQHAIWLAMLRWRAVWLLPFGTLACLVRGGWEWGGGGVTGKVDAVTDAGDRDLGWAPFNGDLGVSENRQGFSRRGAELPRKRLPRVGMEGSYGLDDSQVCCEDSDMCDSILVEVQLGLVGCCGESAEVGVKVGGGEAKLACCMAGFVIVSECGSDSGRGLKVVLPVPVGFGAAGEDC